MDCDPLAIFVVVVDGGGRDTGRIVLLCMIFVRKSVTVSASVQLK